jgi:hypothetical protein
VLLKVRKLEEPLEGGSGTHNTLLVQNDTHLDSGHSDGIYSPDLPSASGQPFKHEPVHLPEVSEDAAATEILSESPVTLPEVIHSGDPSLDIHNQLIGQYSEDSLFKIVFKQPSAYKNFELSNGLIFLKEKDK